MREIIARAVSVLTVVIVVGLSFLFAAEHNPPTLPESFDDAAKSAAAQDVTEVAPPAEVKANDPVPLAMPAGETERGRVIYAQHKCATCHSIGGEGNPRNPLDGAGTRWDANELRDWVTGEGVAKEVLSQAIIKRKQRYKNITEGDMNALVAYLSELKS